MSICRVRKLGLLLAGFGLLASPFLVNGVMAGAFVPKPQEKPVFTQAGKVSYMAPLPSRKPPARVKKSISKSQEKGAVLKQENSVLPKLRSFVSKSVFSDRQARLYREVFNLQKNGDIRGADKKLAGLKNSILMGHVLAERYLHPTAYKASYKELYDWMEKYADHPQASQIYKLALSRKNLVAKKKNKGKIEKPVSYKAISGNLAVVARSGKIYRGQKSRSSQEEKRVRKLSKDIRRHVERKEPTLALNILSNDYAVQFMDDVEYDRLRAQISAGFLYAGKLDHANRLANASLKRSGIYIPQAGWVKGLVHWQKANYKQSAQAFETAATSPYSSGWMISAAAYWASRAHMRAGNVKLVGKWLDLAAIYPRTFYGLIAVRALGHDSEFNWSTPSLTRENIKYIEGTKNGVRAIALIKAGQRNIAELELRNINPGRSIEKQKALLAYADYYQLPSLSMRLANAYTNPKGGLYDSALYPVVGWKPQKGYRVDKALIHAIVRQESRFQVSASNPSGATGLMQLMPATANYVSGHNIYHEPQGRHQLKTPEINLEIGQTYVEELLNHKSVGQDLLSLAIAYNAGPGNLSRWKKERSHMQDPLLFIETIPFNETRAFVERVLSNYWIYRIRMNQKTPSLDAVAKGKWARYAAQDSGIKLLAMMN